MIKKLIKMQRDLEFNYFEYCRNCDKLRDYINNKFNTEIIDGIEYQPSDGIVLLWNGIFNTPLDIEEIENIKSLEELEKYLYENSI